MENIKQVQADRTLKATRQRGKDEAEIMMVMVMIEIMEERRKNKNEITCEITLPLSDL